MPPAPTAIASIDIEVPEAPPASDQADTVEAEPQELSQETPEALAPDTPSPDADAVVALGTPLDAESADAGTDDAEDSAAAPSIGVQAEAVAEGGAVSAAPAESAVSVPLAEIADLKRDAATDQIAEMLSALPPRPIASDRSDAATTEVATALAAEPPAPPPPPASDATEAATETVAKALAASPLPAPVKAATPVVVADAAVPSPPLPKRKPAEIPPAPKSAARPVTPQAAPVTQDAAKPKPQQQETAQSNSGSSVWRPMALAPADKPALKVPTARPGGAAYASKVWAALSRHKPRAGQRGSATVVFSIGENGSLRGVRIGKSSGIARIDQLALQTVRSAAPYPPPPTGPASYTIRIDFQ
jgi:protein TonB